MKGLQFKVGDKCWIAMGRGRLVHGTVILTFDYYGTKQYVVEIETSIDPLLEVRDGFTMSDTPEGPLGYMRRS